MTVFSQAVGALSVSLEIRHGFDHYINGVLVYTMPTLHAVAPAIFSSIENGTIVIGSPDTQFADLAFFQTRTGNVPRTAKSYPIFDGNTGLAGSSPILASLDIDLDWTSTSIPPIGVSGGSMFTNRPPNYRATGINIVSPTIEPTGTSHSG